jgi:putative ABC transport system permease protein
MALAGAVFPALRAARLSPLESMSPVLREDIAGKSYKFTWAGSVLLVAGGATLAGCILGWVPIQLAVWSAMVILLGTVLLVQTVLGGLVRAVAWILSPLVRVESRLAHRQILRHRTRSALTVGVLFVASATGLGLAMQILDNVRDVKNWQQRAIVGDFFVRAMMPDMATGLSADLPDEMGEAIRKVPDIANIDTARFVRAQAAGQDVVVIAREFTANQQIYFDLKGGDREKVRQDLFDGQVVIGTVLAQRTGLGVGDELPLETVQGTRRLRIAGLTNEYLVGGLAVYMERSWAKKLLGIDGVDAYIIKADPRQRSEVEAKLQAICDQYGVLLHSFADISRMIDGMIVGIDACLWGILVLGFVVAAFGVVNTLAMNVLEQTRELGLLRIVAMTRGQIRKTILTQAAIIGSIGLVPGTLTGVAVAYLINLATMPATGHPIEFTLHPLMMLCCFAVAFFIVVAAAWLPAERAARLELLHTLQYE